MKRYGIALIAAVVLSLAVLVISLASRPDVSISQLSMDSAESVLPSVRLEAANAVLDEDLSYRVLDLDAQLYIDGIDGEVGALILDFEQPLPEGTAYQLFYSIGGSGISEGLSIRGETQSEDDLLAIRLPYVESYDDFRLDIDVDYRLEDIAVIDGEALLRSTGSCLRSVFRGERAFPFGELLLYLVILACEALLVAWKLDAIRDAARRLATQWRAWAKPCALCLACALAGGLIWGVLSAAGLLRVSSRYGLFGFAALGLCAGALFCVRSSLGEHPERGFFIIAMCVGLLFAVLEPSAMMLSWDDETHYARAVSLSYGNTAYRTVPENALSHFGVSADITPENRQSTDEYLNRLYDSRIGDDDNGYAPVEANFIPAYLPAAGTLWLTRLLGVPFARTVVAGRIANLLCYALVMCLAIRQLRYGRLFVATLGLLPAMLFLAGNYSYDAFCTAFIMLGFCVWLGVWQTPGATMTTEKTGAMLLSLIVGILVKAVYFPIALTVIFLPANRFASPRAARRYRLWVLLMTLALIASFVIPYLTGAQAYNDTRGGVGVDSRAQIVNILAHPAAYLKMLADFLAQEYFSLSMMLNAIGGCLRSFAYVAGQGIVFSELLTGLLLALIFTAWLGSTGADGEAGATVPPWIRSIAAVLALGAICVAATSLYCAYTPVGSEWISGFQERYMLPVMLPLLVVARPTFLRNGTPSGRFGAAVLCSEAALLWLGMWPLMQRYL